MARPHTTSTWSIAPDSGATARRYLTAVLLDTALPFAPAGSRCGSALMLPLASGRVIDQLASAVATLSTGRTLVVAAPGVTCDWNGRSAGLRIVEREGLGDVLAGCETGDYLLLVEARHRPLVGYDFGWVIDQSRDCTGATYAMVIGQSGSRAAERVEADAAGHVRRVQRVYSAAAWSGSAAGTVVCAVVPAMALQGISFDSLGDLRSQLATRGLLTHDLPVMSDLADLTDPAGVLTMAEQVADSLLHKQTLPGMVEVRPRVFAGIHCNIARSARLVGPAVLHDHVVIGEGATVIGPCLIGAGAQIGKNAVVAQSVLLAGAIVADDASLCNEIVSEQRTIASTGPDRTPGHLSVRAPNSCVSRHLVVADLPRQRRSRRRRLSLACKRGADVVLASAGLLMLLPLLLVVAAIIKMTSPGPLFFIHRREGYGGKDFGCLKFRTMVPGAHKAQREMYGQNQVDGPQFKMDNDPRVTRIGRFLRRSNIDELPQLFNVVAGQMSLVGPRPSPFRENQICVAWRRARLSVVPGITGLWQICRDRQNDADFHQWIYYDLAYVKHFSLWLDAKILFYTFASMGGRVRVPLSRLLLQEALVPPPHQGVTDDPGCIHQDAANHV
jgi:lipopolysaccharide/colanic/teichoic acid biosynthesis glycosyltransferase